jgi:hypothetical protein
VCKYNAGEAYLDRKNLNQESLVAHTGVSAILAKKKLRFWQKKNHAFGRGRDLHYTDFDSNMQAIF